jgi:hypothetical protein
MMEELAPGIRRWTAPHPEWRPAVEEVESYALVAGEVLLLVDPLLPSDDDERLEPLLAGLGLLAAAVANNVHGGLAVTLALASLSLLFCLGLAAFNRRLQSRTGSPTPWRGSLYAAIAVAIALGLSIAR